MIFKITQVVTTHLNTLQVYYQVDTAQKELTISSQIFKRLNIMVSQTNYGLLCLVVFRNKFRKKMINDSFDIKVIHYLSKNEITPGFIENLSNSTKEELKTFLE